MKGLLVIPHHLIYHSVHGPCFYSALLHVLMIALVANKHMHIE